MQQSKNEVLRQRKKKLSNINVGTDGPTNLGSRTTSTIQKETSQGAFQWIGAGAGFLLVCFT